MATTKNGIPYPNNYNAAADVPEDIKKMAEATDALIDTLKTDVADIKKDIDNIEKEQSDQNTTISDINLRVEDNAKSIEELTAENTALKEELERQKEDNKLNGLTEDNEGELVHIENTTGARFNSLEIFGNEKQDTREGSPSFNYPSEIKAVENSINLTVCNKNILDIQKNATVEKGGVTVTTDENGVLTLNGTTTTNIYIKLNGKDIVDNNISNWKKSCFRKGTYKFTSEVLTTTQAGNINAFLRKDVYETEGQYATLYQLMNAKTKTATANILEDTEAVVYLWIASGITLNNAKLKFQIELDNATDIVVHEEQFFVVPVQQKMLSGDKFIKVNGKWKEMHTWLELFFDGVNRKFNQEATNTSGKYRLLYHISEKVKNCDTTNGTKAYCSNSKLTAKGATYSCNEGFTVSNNIIYIYIDGRTASAINAELQDNQITFYIPLKEDDYKYLDCTEEQIKVLDKIEKEAHTYLNTTNIYTEDEIGTIIKTNTNVDLKSLINNIQEQLIAE